MDRGRQFESALWKELMLLLGSTRIRTTAYHPCTNGMVECFRQLKASLKSCPPPTVRWTDSLPLILLGICAALKQDLNCSTAELVYGTTLRVPGEFFTPARDKELEDPTSYVTRLRSTMRQLQSVPSRTRDSNVYIHDDLLSSSHVFVRHDGVRTSLQPPYNGPFKVVKRSEKFYTLDINGRKDTVSLDRLKPAYLEDAPEPTTFEPSPATPSLRFPHPGMGQNLKNWGLACLSLVWGCVTPAYRKSIHGFVLVKGCSCARLHASRRGCICVSFCHVS